jgi:hypothetical protein
MEPTTTMAAIIRAITATITGMVADTTETIIGGEDGMIGIDHENIEYKVHPGDLGEISGAARFIL